MGCSRKPSRDRLRYVVGRKRRRRRRDLRAGRGGLRPQGRGAVLLVKSASSRMRARCAPTPRRASGSGWAPRSTVKRRPLPLGARSGGACESAHRMDSAGRACSCSAVATRSSRSISPAARPGSRITQGDHQRGVIGVDAGLRARRHCHRFRRPSRAGRRGELGAHGRQRESADRHHERQRRRQRRLGRCRALPGRTPFAREFQGAGDVLFTAIAQPIAGAITFRYLDAGGYHACGITTTEQLLCWGYNADGQLGLGTTSVHSDPNTRAGRLPLPPGRRRILPRVRDHAGRRGMVLGQQW